METSLLRCLTVRLNHLCNRSCCFHYHFTLSIHVSSTLHPFPPCSTPKRCAQSGTRVQPLVCRYLQLKPPCFVSQWLPSCVLRLAFGWTTTSYTPSTQTICLYVTDDAEYSVQLYLNYFLQRVENVI